jgi:hypothetical protein
LPKAEMDSNISKGPFPEECRVSLNQVASYQMHISDVYLSMVSMGS